MCGTPERNLASSLSNMMSRSFGLLQDIEDIREKDRELRRREKRMKEVAAEAKQEREELAIQKQGSLRTETAGNGIDVTKGTAQQLQYKEERDKMKDIKKIDDALEEELRASFKARVKNSSRIHQSIFNSIGGPLFSTIGKLF